MEQITNPNYRIDNVELNWAKLDPQRPTEAFGNIQWEMQISTDDANLAKEWSAIGLNVKEKDGKFNCGLKRKAHKKDGSPNRPVTVVGADNTPLDPTKIGNGSRGNVILYRYNYDYSGRKGMGAMLNGVQVIDLVEYNPVSATGFDIVDGGNTHTPADEAAPLF